LKERGTKPGLDQDPNSFSTVAEGNKSHAVDASPFHHLEGVRTGKAAILVLVADPQAFQGEETSPSTLNLPEDP